MINRLSSIPKPWTSATPKDDSGVACKLTTPVCFLNRSQAIHNRCTLHMPSTLNSACLVVNILIRHRTRVTLSTTSDSSWSSFSAFHRLCSVSSTSLGGVAGLPYAGDNLVFDFTVENEGTSSLAT